MSMLFTLKNRSSILSIDFPVPIELNGNFNYGLALIGFYTYNTIPNVEKYNKLYFYSDGNEKVLTFPIGTYEISDMEEFIRRKLEIKTSDKVESPFFLRPNNNTLKCEIFHEKYNIDFGPKDSIGALLGFSSRILEAGQVHESDLPVDIIKVRTINIDCNLIEGSFINERPSHSLYEFAINSDPGYGVNEIPNKVVYLPITTHRIHNITVKILDQDGELVNFRGEEIILRLQLKRCS